MEENLEPNNKANNEISDNSTKSNSEEIKEPESELLNTKANNSAPKIDLKTDIGYSNPDNMDDWDNDNNDW